MNKRIALLNKKHKQCYTSRTKRNRLIVPACIACLFYKLSKSDVTIFYAGVENDHAILINILKDMLTTKRLHFHYFNTCVES